MLRVKKLKFISSGPALKRKPRRPKPPREPGMTIDANTQLVLRIPYPYVSGNHATRHAEGGHYSADDAVRYRGDVALAVRRAGLRVRLEGPLSLEYELFPPNKAVRDSCNALKVFKDALTLAGFWQDDNSRVVRREVIEWGQGTKDEAYINITVRGYAP